jgi:tetratricopeptide (TPR) repeat protein
LAAPLAILVGAAGLVMAAAAPQEKPSPTSEYQYRKDFAEVEGIMKETDAQKRAERLLAFVKEHPQSRMIPYVSGYYAQIVAEHQKAAAWPKVIEMEDALLALVPDDKTATAGLLGAYYQSKNFAKAAEMAEKMYAKTPDKALAETLADIYLQMQNVDKFLPYAEKVVAEFPIEQSYVRALQVASIYASRNDLPKASEYAGKVVAALGDKVPQGVQEKDWNTSRASMYSILGAAEYAKKDCAKAVEHYDKVVAFDPKNDAAHYTVGMCKWRSQDLDNAMAAFARAAVLNKATSKKAQEYLEQIYKPRHNNTLDGMDQLIAKAKSEVGVS